MNARNEAVKAVHGRICEESLSEHMDPKWPGRCVKAVQAAAPHLMAARADAAEATVRRVRDLLDATDPNRYAILSMEGLRVGLRSALSGEGEPA